MRYTKGMDGCKILCIDDDKNTFVTIRDFLESFGYQVCAAYDAASGLEMVRDWQPDLILLDLVLPDISGFKIAQEIKNAPAWAHIPIIAISLKHEDVDKHVAAKSGAIDYLEKPVSLEKLAYSIKEALGQKS
jgi:DNA-binding response OmpR family regulator